jgi:hypothetical protein
MCEHCGLFLVAYTWRRIKVMRLCAPCFQFVLHGWLKNGNLLLPVIRLTAPLPMNVRKQYIVDDVH